MRLEGGVENSRTEREVILRRFGRDRRRLHRATNHTNPTANETNLRAKDGDVRRQPSQRLLGDDEDPSASHDGPFSILRQTEISNNEYRSREVEKLTVDYRDQRTFTLFICNMFFSHSHFFLLCLYCIYHPFPICELSTSQWT